MLCGSKVTNVSLIRNARYVEIRIIIMSQRIKIVVENIAFIKY